MIFPQWFLSDSKTSSVKKRNFWDEYWSNWESKKNAFIADRKTTADYLFNHLGLQKTGLNCLDIGGGGGGIAYNLLSYNSSIKITIADISLKSAQRLLCNEKCRFVYQDVHKPLSKDIINISPYDKIWICELDYLLSNNEWVRLLKQCRDILKPNGQIAITTASLFNLKNQLIFMCKTFYTMIKSNFKVLPHLNGIARSIYLHRKLIKKALPYPCCNLVKEDIVKAKKHKRINFQFGRSDCGIYGFVLEKL